MQTRAAYIFFLLAAVVAHVSAGGGACYAPPTFYGSTCTSDTAVFPPAGATSSYKIYYSVTVTGNGGTLVCCNGKGFNPSETWTSIGCGYDNFSGSTVWGNNLAQPAIKCKGVPFGATVSWKH